jgi:hypothetical protein
MSLSRSISLVVVAIYLIAFLLVPLSKDAVFGNPPDGKLFISQFAGGFLLLLGFVCVWWSEVLGDALWVGRGAWNPQPSSGGAVRLLGWIFLISAFLIHVIVHHYVG